MVAGQEAAGVEDEGRWRPVVGGCEESTSVLLTALRFAGGALSRKMVELSIVLKPFSTLGRHQAPDRPSTKRQYADQPLAGNAHRTTS
jgi:hypothetical protein